MPDRGISCCFTGHRFERLPWLKNEADPRTQFLVDELWRLILQSYDDGYRHYLCGMAVGVDLLCARLVLQLVAEDPTVKLIPVIPFREQAENWSEVDRSNYRKILKLCGRNAVLLSPDYYKGCFMVRNRYMIDHSNRVIGVFDGISQGGTYQTLRYARECGLELALICPE
ncbi:MAG: DUF1273 family protein [Oscillospiraceae bacterium]|nr:DUF1273 family protein [Oscillospiraceae bacterium]